jgi:glycosyltransferase involved in cell wall biosynthesis
MNFNYFVIKDELFWRNESINYNKLQEEILKYKCNHFKISFENKKDFYERENPKISIIITIYNQKEFINKIYTCIQNQSIKDIEIIFVDDASIDGSNRIINLLMKKDKRIIYIKNKINKGQYYSRYKGIMSAKGRYISIIDPDDFLLNDILAKAYTLANYYKLDIVQYYHLKGNITENNVLKLNISGIFYHNIKEAYYKCSYRYLWDKLILRKIYLKSIQFIKEKYRNSRIIIHNDEVACYAVFRVANSYAILEQVGYFYNRENQKSITKQNFKPENINGRFYSLFTIMEYYFDQSNNNTLEKTNGGYNFFKLRIDFLYRKKIKYLTEGFIYINNILDLYIKSKFFNKNQRNELKRFRERIIKQQILIFNLTNNNQSCLNNTHFFSN